MNALRAATLPLLASLLLVTLTCRTPEPPPGPPLEAGSVFSAELAFGHLESLVEIGPRVPGTPGGQAALDYIRASLGAIGIAVSEQTRAYEDRGDGEPLVVRNLVGEIPGESSDVILLVSGYDTTAFETFSFVGANSNASGVALLLELARVLAQEPLPYTVRLAFTGADAPQGPPGDRLGYWGSVTLFSELQESGDLDRVRLAVFFEQVGDADLRIARDLRSHRTARDLFFRAAREQGESEVFPKDAGFDSVATGHLVFLEGHFRRVLAIKDPRYGGEDPPGAFWNTEEDVLARVSSGSLGAVGRVSHEALQDAAALLQRVDRFATKRVDEPAPTPGDGETVPEPTPEPLEPGPPTGGPDADAAGGEAVPPPPAQEVPPETLSAPPEDGVPRF
jgi:hypothetical protein